jgi:wyosine [tRNA(Phe)-imidazoG37] synthetase (radical SAM superfamily)
MTALFDDVIFGPVRSRRLGLSLGVNLLPLASKLCNFDCIYCECGWNAGGRGEPGGDNTRSKFNSREEVRRLLGGRLREMAAAGECPDVITFAGNGGPTTHPDFEAIIGDTLALRDEICPSAKVSVLSNATMIGRESVRRALERVDNNILKLDSAFDDTVRLVNGPQGSYSVAETVANMKRFEGRLIVQTMFLRGTCNGQTVDNTTEREVAAWLELVREIAPRQVMIYTIDRDTPVKELEKVPVEELRAIAARVEALGIPVSVAG